MQHHGSILVISGTNRPASATLHVSRRVTEHYREAGVPVELVDLQHLPPETFLPSSYRTKPPSFAPLQGSVLESAGLHVVLPEYNGSFPGVLKYFIDLLKFPESFDRKPVAFVGIASGMWGGLRAVEQMQMVFGYRNAHAYPDRVFISAIHQKLTPEGALTDPAIDGRLASQAKGFAQFCGLFGKPSQPGKA